MLCKDSWIDISWDGLPKRKQKENLRVIFNQKADKIISFDQACDQTAQEIYSQYKNLYVAFSGGADSEGVVDALHRNKIPFTPLILIYDNVKDQEQLKESSYAFDWCRKYQIEPLVVHSKNLVGSIEEKTNFLDIRPRYSYGAITATLLKNTIESYDGFLVTGYQLEYYPDHEQMTYLEPQLGNYAGFVLEETDLYLETVIPNTHPWGFYYWSPTIMAAFVNQWDTSLTMTKNKSQIYKVAHRPKMSYPQDLLSREKISFRKMLSSQFGTLDCALLGTKESLLEKLVK
jgi:hypothetical protein